MGRGAWDAAQQHRMNWENARGIGCLVRPSLRPGLVVLRPRWK